jgi:hypothetical protein
LGRVRQAEQIEAVKEMGERHAKEALMLQNKAIERLRQLRAEELKPRETLDFLVGAAKLERQARGELPNCPELHKPEDNHSGTDIFKRIEQYAKAFRPFLGPSEPRLESGDLPGHRGGKPLDQAQTDAQAEGGTAA